MSWYAVLESKVLTDRGKALIWDNKHDFESQKVYQKLNHLRFTNQDGNIRHSSWLGEGTWNGATRAFIIYW
jgi:hypothetical protein